jgi:hypothetical protein
MTLSLSRVVGALLLALTVVVTVLMAVVWTLLPLDNVGLTVHGETFSLSDLHGTSAILFFVFSVAAVVLALIAAMVAVVVGLGLGALGLAVGLLATIASLALVVAPFALIVWLVWRLLRTRQAPVVTGGP